LVENGALIPGLALGQSRKMGNRIQRIIEKTLFLFKIPGCGY
jgi:hypothetical protein